MIVIMLISVSAYSQLNAYGEGVFNTVKNSKARLGIGIIYLHPITDAFNLGVNVGYRQTLSGDFFAGQIPIMGVARYYVMGDATGFYPQASLGIAYSFSRMEILNTKIKAHSTNFGFNVGAGYRVDDTVDFTLLYENIVYSSASSNAFILRVAFNF